MYYLSYFQILHKSWEFEDMKHDMQSVPHEHRQHLERLHAQPHYTFIYVAWLHFPALWLHASTVSQLSNELQLLRASHPELCEDERQMGQRQCIICAGVKRGGERRGRSHPWWEDWGMMKGKHSSRGRYWKLVGAGLFFSLERKTFLWTLNSSKKCWQLLMNMSALCEELLKKWSSELNQHWDVVFFHKNCEC